MPTEPSSPRVHPAGGGPDYEKTGDLVRNATKVVGAVFLLVGVLGFVPGITTDYDTMQLAGHESEAKLLGIFQVSILHNIVHLLFGVVGLAMARTVRTATTYLLAGGAVYLALAVYGAVVGKQGGGNFVPVNSADDLLHLVLGLGMVGLGLMGLRARPGSIGAGGPA